MQRLGHLIAWTVVIGCTACSNAGEESMNTGETGISIETGSVETSGAETGETPCIEEACDATCSLELDECGEAMAGYCELSDSCKCYPTCFDCESEVCGPWEQCDPERGCHVCYTTHDVDWDPALACMFDLAGLDPIMMPYIGVEISGIDVPAHDSCDAMPVGMVWLPDMQLQLCPNTCAAFENAGQLEVIINCPGGP